MENEFVPYKLSVKLKALGFNEKCFGGYDYVTEDQEPEFKLALFSVNNDPKWYESRKMIPSPLWQQAFDWFRMQHRLNPTIISYWQNDWKDFSYHYIYQLPDEYNRGIFEAYEGMPYKTYEEARLACLKMLIELVKIKKG